MMSIHRAKALKAILICEVSFGQILHIRRKPVIEYRNWIVYKSFLNIQISENSIESICIVREMRVGGRIFFFFKCNCIIRWWLRRTSQQQFHTYIHRVSVWLSVSVWVSQPSVSVCECQILAKYLNQSTWVFAIW